MKRRRRRRRRRRENIPVLRVTNFLLIKGSQLCEQ
jgi:hypothetical protein